MHSAGRRAPQGRVPAHRTHEANRKRPLGCGCCCDHHCGPETVRRCHRPCLCPAHSLWTHRKSCSLTVTHPGGGWRTGVEHPSQRPFSWVGRTESPGAMRCHLLGEGITQEGALGSQAQLSLPPWGHLGPNSNVNNKNSSSQLFPWDSLGYKLQTSLPTESC